jgi:mono/diheme cytochrome c family protein
VPFTAQKLIRTFLFPLGLALLMAAFLFQEGTAFNISPQITPMPTLDRLAEPTLPVSPSQADHGAQLYWLHCMPCHGDKGQGLTDEFRDTYPPEDNNCWARGCHGRNPYEDGFTLPTTVPRLIGSGALTKFASVANLNGFIRAAMPFEDPGVLTEDEYWQVTAFLLRENQIGYDEQLDASSAAQILLPWAQQPTPTPTPLPLAPSSEDHLNWTIFLLIFLLGGILFLWHTLRRK